MCSDLSHTSVSSDEASGCRSGSVELDGVYTALSGSLTHTGLYASTRRSEVKQRRELSAPCGLSVWSHTFLVFSLSVVGVAEGLTVS